MATIGSIPYERQEDARKCGAAALNMIYRAFGDNPTQEMIWPKIAQDQWSARTHLLAKDANDRGLSAAVLQVCDLQPVIERRRDGAIAAIVSHRLQPGSRQGHFSVLVGETKKHLILHDPFHGPGRMIGYDDFRELWGWEAGSPEVSGNVVVAIAKSPPPIEPCDECGETMPDDYACHQCGTVMPLPTVALLGCGNPHCSRKTWRRIFCPACDLSIRGFADDKVMILDPTKSKTSVMGLIIDLLAARARHGAELCPNPAMRELLSAIADYCPFLKEQTAKDAEELIALLRKAKLRSEGLERRVAEIESAGRRRREERREQRESQRRQQKLARSARRMAPSAGRERAETVIGE